MLDIAQKCGMEKNWHKGNYIFCYSYNPGMSWNT